MAESHTKLYPKLIIKNNEHPSKLLAFPFFGILIKFILLIPVFIVLWIYSIAYLFFWLILPFYILFTGKYMDAAYKFILGYAKLYTKVDLYMYGLTDKYPGFGLDDGGLFELHFEKPAHPNRWLALPLIGFLVRGILLIPYMIFVSVLQNGSLFAMIGSWFAVLFKGKYPESFYEFNRDTIRTSIAFYMYIAYLSDTYPSFWISMKHKTTKIILIILGALMFLGQMGNPNPETQTEEELLKEFTNQNLDY